MKTTKVTNLTVILPKFWLNYGRIGKQTSRLIRHSTYITKNKLYRRPVCTLIQKVLKKNTSITELDIPRFNR